jgi:hypothetical protein
VPSSQVNLVVEVACLRNCTKMSGQPPVQVQLVRWQVKPGLPKSTPQALALHSSVPVWPSVALMLAYM